MGVFLYQTNPEGGWIGKAILIGGIAVGGYYLYKSSKKTTSRKKVVEDIEEIIDEARIPMPHFVMTIPRTDEELSVLDDHLCSCMDAIRQQHPDLEDTETLIELLHECVAQSVYPDFPWPPFIGDHSTVEQLWLILEFRIRTLAAEGRLDTLCAPIPPPPGIPKPEPLPVGG